MFSFCHNFCWLLGESFINCENLTDYCIKNNTIISNLYVEGIWFEPDSDESKEITSFRIDKNFSIKVKTTFIDSSQKIRTYIIRDDGKIIEK